MLKRIKLEKEFFWFTTISNETNVKYKTNQTQGAFSTL